MQCARFLVFFWSISEQAEANHVPTLTGSFRVATGNRDLSSCHECLAVSVGVKELCLLESNSRSRLYWVEGHLDILRAFIAHCSTEKLCRVPDHISKTYTLADSIRSGEQSFIHVRIQMQLEDKVSFLAKSIHSAVMTSEAVMWRAQSNQEKHSFMHKKTFRIPFFDEEDSTIIDQASVVLDTFEVVSESNAQNRQFGPTSIQCMVIPGASQSYVCRECLAMHSVSLAIETYSLFYISKGSSAELCILPTYHRASDIIKNCRGTFCDTLFSWDPSDCDRIAEILQVQRRQLHKFVVPNDEPMHLDHVRDILRYIASKRMARSQGRKLFPPHVFSSTKHMGIQKEQELRCIKITASLNFLWGCIGCVAKNLGGARVVIILSTKMAMILTDPIEHIGSGHFINAEMHSRPTITHQATSEQSACYVFFHNPSYKKACYTCMTQAFAAKARNIHTTTKYSMLVDTVQLSAEENNALFDKLQPCHKLVMCTRMQMVPYKFCSEHQTYVSTAKAQSIDRTAFNEFNRSYIPVGVWPPQTYRVTLIPHTLEIEHDKQISPYFSKIALVQFKYETSKQFHCLQCLIEHTEIFLIYSDESASGGYVWMRQMVSGLLKSCVGEKCLSLAYDEQHSQIIRPAGLRQFTKEDLPLRPSKD
ncbi:unnamed protein product [Albugo candida]|uniref:Uncharacterized protein n=1 Tax=Albugo candida TaxID=65357 RepID=A0A024GKW2_9STRA|nr:unnamed protein product [Albugo candida]|eukprot:CCI47364.1 unnamed protein product [Albugo candida]